MRGRHVMVVFRHSPVGVTFIVLLTLILAPYCLSYTDAVTGMEFVPVKGGCFEMGDTFGEGYFAEGPAHVVCLDDFRIGRHEVTKQQWKTVMGDSAQNAGGEENHPVGSVNYHDVQAFIEKLNQRTGKQYRLPTEAEWEYACRSGGKKERFAGLTNRDDLFLYANFCDASCQYNWMTTDQDDGYEGPSPVGTYRPNGLGLYDMSGNVWEWVADWFDQNYYERSPTYNPGGPDSGSDRVIRGGCWLSGQFYPRCAYRLGIPASMREADIGFRLAVGGENRENGK